MTSGDDLGMSPAGRAPAGGSAAVTPDITPVPVRPVVVVFWWITLAALAVISVIPLGATRVFASPWSFVYAAALLGPAILLVARGFDRDAPLALPTSAWCLAGVAGAGVLVLSAASSPYRSTTLLWSAPWLGAVAMFFVTHDWLNASPAQVENRRRRLQQVTVGLFTLVALASLGEWLLGLREFGFARILAGRNAYPLGHANYTAGLAIIMLPWLIAAVFRAAPAVVRMVAAAGALGCLAMLFSSGSRAGLIALVIVGALGVFAAPLRRSTKAWAFAIAAMLAAVFVVANPRTRAMLQPAEPDAPPNISNVQRHAMLVAGIRMGADRPLLGWGPGATPLAFPRYRGGLDGGAENVLQLHSLPVQLWAELGLAGVLGAAVIALLVGRDARREPAAAIALAGYATYSLFDAQLDVPLFGYTLAALTALIAAPRRSGAGRTGAGAMAVFTVAVVAVVVAFGHRDRTAAINVEALRDDVGRHDPQRAIGLLRQSLALNPDQEIAHFNLGWLLVVDDPVAAGRHFTRAAELVPDKGGVYFGLGLARLNAGDNVGAARAFALEALNDPVFLLSPWWKNPQVGALRADTAAQLDTFAAVLVAKLPAQGWTGRELRYVRALSAWLAGRADAGAVAAAADTPARRAFFERGPERTALQSLESHTLRRQRVGYPVLMRNLDLAPPLDLWVVQESTARESALAYLWPDKGWLPSPLLIALLHDADPRKN